VYDDEIMKKIKRLDLVNNLEKISKFSSLRYSIRKKMLFNFICESIRQRGKENGKI
jgi:hypothetical protein